MSCGVGHRGGSDPALLWLQCRLAASAPIRPLAWEPPYAAGMALKRKKKKNQHERKGCDIICKIRFPKRSHQVWGINPLKLLGLKLGAEVYLEG